LAVPEAERNAVRPHRWLAAFFAFGATMSALTVALLLFPGTVLDSLWRLNPDAHAAFQTIGAWAVALMLAVGIACGITAIGLWRGASWGSQMAIVILIVNAIGDLSNVVLRHDYHGLIGLPIAAAIIFWLIRPSPNRE
jgi:uncharacterized membrane protein (DUF2068 family)